LIQVEFELSKLLKEDGEADSTAAGRIMIAVGRVLTLSVHHRLQIRNPLLRFFGELHVFAERAILDCADTVDAAEKARTEYRGSLLRNKEKLDGLKLDTLQKVDLLAASRCNLFSQVRTCKVLHKRPIFC
uniref:AH domain-containing protein n=1 Tax=Gongylonema pulchrum TaxID=637853 RepID=A0A183D840_9BILA